MEGKQTRRDWRIWKISAERKTSGGRDSERLKGPETPPAGLHSEAAAGEKCQIVSEQRRDITGRLEEALLLVGSINK